ncbi:MAG: hypothetical protein QOG77_2170 [Solirubrobacteraceae bacterium]|nr:hypothetical protein [Solirubrobacteraceae bacterium]
MRVGLVLGAGGVIGGSWLIGALDAFEAETGWRAADAEQIVGTSAGAVIATGHRPGTSVPAAPRRIAEGSRDLHDRFALAPAAFPQGRAEDAPTEGRTPWRPRVLESRAAGGLVYR